MGRIKDISGQKFNRLNVIKLSERRSSSGECYWICRCDCGNETEVLGSLIRSGKVKSCGCLQKEKAKELIKKQHINNNKKNNLVGKEFGKLTVIRSTERRDSNRGMIWECQCDCGNFCYVSTGCLKEGKTMSCGCLKQSKGEYLAEKALKNIKYKKEYTFSDLKGIGNGYLRFDFAVFDDNNTLLGLIEFDGIQHL